MFGKEFDRFNAASWSDETGLLLAASPASQKNEGHLQTATLNALPIAVAMVIVTVVTIAVEAKSMISLLASGVGVAAMQCDATRSDTIGQQQDFTPRPREITPEFRKASLARILDKWKVGLDLLA